MAIAREAAPGGRGSIDRIDEPGVGVARDETDAGEPSGDEAAQEGGRGGAVLLGDDVEAERLAVALAVDPLGPPDEDDSALGSSRPVWKLAPRPGLPYFEKPQGSLPSAVL